MKALSIRQPRATLIHAAKGVTRDEYADSKELVEQLVRRGAQILLPAFDELPRGGFVDVADFTGCVHDTPSPRYFGKFGFTRARPAVALRTCQGSAGLLRSAAGDCHSGSGQCAGRRCGCLRSRRASRLTKVARCNCGPKTTSPGGSSTAWPAPERWSWSRFLRASAITAASIKALVEKNKLGP